MKGQRKLYWNWKRIIASKHKKSPICFSQMALKIGSSLVQQPHGSSLFFSLNRAPFYVL